MSRPRRCRTRGEWLFWPDPHLAQAGNQHCLHSHRWNEIKDIADRITIYRNGERVGTYAATELSETDAVEYMTGRKLHMLYPS